MKPRNIRKKLIEDKLSLITDSINEVSDNLPSDFKEFAKLGLIKDGIYKKIEFAIENIIDICNIINSDLRLGVPEVEDDIFNNLETKKIFDKKIIDIIKEMKSFRKLSESFKSPLFSITVTSSKTKSPKRPLPKMTKDKTKDSKKTYLSFIFGAAE